MSLINRNIPLKIVVLQIFLMILISSFFLYKWGNNAGISSVLGGLITIVPGLLFIFIFFRFGGARAAPAIVNRFYFGEIVKLLTTLLLFTLVFQWSKLKPVPLFVCFVLTQMAYWLAPFLKRSNKGLRHE